MKSVLRLLPLLAALTMAAASAAPLRWAAQNDIQTLDPHSQNHSATTTITGYAYEGLTRYTEKFDVEPALATKWTYVTPTQVRFELRRGVKFHDGSPFTADDVVFSLIKDGDHRLSRDQDLARLAATVEEVAEL